MESKKMGEFKTKFFRPPAPSHDKDRKSPANTKDKVAMYTFQNAQLSQSSTNISPGPAPMPKLLAPTQGRLTPTGQGRIKAPPVCMAPALKRVASGIDAFNTVGVCFSPKEAAICAGRALLLDRNEFNSHNVEETPLNIDKCDPEFLGNFNIESTVTAPALTCQPEGKAFVSSNSTVVTTSTTSSCLRGTMGSEIAAMAAANKDPPLEVVRTDSAVNSEDEHHPVGVGSAIPRHESVPASAAMKAIKPPQLTVTTAHEATSTALSTAFTDNLVKEKSSRQGRTLQRWLIHSPTEELVRQVAGTVPITRDGRIILVSASRKMEWILPKGGWDLDETKEECAVRETFEEAGLLGRLGGCFEPIDYETYKARKRRLDKLRNGGSVEKKCGHVVDKGGFKIAGDVEGGKGEHRKGCCPPLPKRPRGEMAPISTLLTSPVSPITKPGSSESTDTHGVSSVNDNAANQLENPSASMLFDPKNYSYVRLFLFPLYVTSVKSDWPEKGRLRKLVDIDEAIKIMKAENRLYFQRGLEMAKERGLHLLKPEISLKLSLSKIEHS